MTRMQLLPLLYFFAFYSLNLRLAIAFNSCSSDIAKLYHDLSAQMHTVTTDDGYILQMFRIPPSQPQNIAVIIILMHDIMCSSDDFVVGGADGWMAGMPSGALDIWLPNVRGNKYSMGHTTLDASTNGSYWNFSFHEIGVYDLPKIIDYITNLVDGQKPIYYYGFGQGATIFYAMSSMLPEYKNKITINVAIAPIVFLSDVQSSYIRNVSYEFIENPLLMEEYSSKKFIPSVEFFDEFGRPECKETTNNSAICDNIYFLMGSYDSSHYYNDLEKSFILSHIPTTCSAKQLLHYAQLVISGRFAQYDYGTEMNMIYYNSATPPDYNLEGLNIVSEVILASYSDLTTSEFDLQHLMSVFNKPMSFMSNCNNFSHIDFWNLTAGNYCQLEHSSG